MYSGNGYPLEGQWRNNEISTQAWNVIYEVMNNGVYIVLCSTLCVLDHIYAGAKHDRFRSWRI